MKNLINKLNDRFIYELGCIYVSEVMYMIDGYRGINVNVSVMEKLKKIQQENNLPSYNAAVKFLLDKAGVQ